MMRGGVAVTGIVLLTVFALVIAMAVPAVARKWTSKDGRFSTEAELVEVADGKVKLQKESGETVTVPLERLSMADRRYVASMKNKLAEKKKSAQAESPAAGDRRGGGGRGARGLGADRTRCGFGGRSAPRVDCRRAG